MPNEDFFHRNIWACADNLGIWGTFGLFISTHFGTVSSLSKVFHLSTIIFTKKLSFYIQMPNIYLGLGFEFGPQRIRDLALVYP